MHPGTGRRALEIEFLKKSSIIFFLSMPHVLKIISAAGIRKSMNCMSYKCCTSYTFINLRPGVFRFIANKLVRCGSADAVAAATRTDVFIYQFLRRKKKSLMLWAHIKIYWTIHQQEEMINTQECCVSLVHIIVDQKRYKE